MRISIKRILKTCTVALALILSLVTLSVSSATNTSAADIRGGVCNGYNKITGETGTCGVGEDVDEGLSNTANNLIDLFSLIIGVAAVAMIIYGGFKFITSGGSDDGTKSAKQTILYALVGLVVVLLAQTIVKYVFGKATSITSGGGA